jgi:hypothetical protein
MNITIGWIHGSSDSEVTKLRAGRSGLISRRCNNGIFSLRHRFQTGSGVHPASYPMGTGGCYPGEKAASSRMREAIPPLPIRLHGVVIS